MAAPATAIVGYDLDFAAPCQAGAALRRKPERQLAENPEKARYMACAAPACRRLFHCRGARAGLDCGPMSGFDNAGVDKEFFAGTQIKSYFLCNLGYGVPAACAARRPPWLRRSCKIL
jgi:3-hydroxypropanoate dehydrogenase